MSSLSNLIIISSEFGTQMQVNDCAVDESARIEAHKELKKGLCLDAACCCRELVMDPDSNPAEVSIVSRKLSAQTNSIVTTDLVHSVQTASITAVADLIHSNSTICPIQTAIFGESDHSCEVMAKRSDSVNSSKMATSEDVTPDRELVSVTQDPVDNPQLELVCRDVCDNGDQMENETPNDDQGDALGFGRSKASRGPKNVARMPTEKDSEIYNMNHKRRGVAFIFNHMHFDPRLQLKERNGTHADAENLKRTLRQLGFEVRPFNDLPFRDIERLLEECALENHDDADCIWVSVLSHGEMGILYASDHAYKPDRLWSHFNAERCPSLAGKPKMFFIQACQGDQLDGGIRLEKCSTTEIDSSALSYKIPSHADFLIAYSTIPGFYSWRNTTAGSWFVQALCEILLNESHAKDLLSILTRVARKVAFDFQSNTPGSPSMHERKQIPCITSMLTRDIYFARKVAYDF
eukprot:TCALIF_03091-PB protein Name:"Similar to Caspase-1 (Spodoptera frugiperda)" AED:0.13 eAED:0.13 QI:0/0/0.33/0.66/0.5/0.66/3/83/463